LFRIVAVCRLGCPDRLSKIVVATAFLAAGGRPEDSIGRHGAGAVLNPASPAGWRETLGMGHDL